MQRWRERQGSGFESEKWAMLELELGRFGLVAAIASGFILVFTAYIASIIGTNPPIIGNFPRREMALWFWLLAMGFLVSGFTVAKKIGPYRQGFRSAHFVSSILAFAVATVFLLIGLVDHLGILNIDPIEPIMWPASSFGVSFALVSLALTWEGVGLRRLASMISAITVPVSLTIVPLVGIPFDDARLVLIYALDAMFVVFSGSLLLLIASAGEASQREILRASDTKFAALKQEMANKIQAIEYKEKAYLDRETHLDAKEKDLLEIESELDARAKELNSVQARLDEQGRTMKGLESKLAKMRAEVETKVEEYGLKEKDLKVARGQIEGARAALTEREQGLADREKELKRLQIEVTSQQRAFAAKTGELRDLEARLKKEGGTVDVRRDEVIKREKELALKASEVKLKIEQLEAQQAKDVKEKVAQLRDWESKVLAKEREVSDREMKLQSLSEELKQRQSDGDAYAAALQSERERLASREQELNSREKKISDSDSTLEEKEAEIERRWKEVIDAQKRLESRETEYSSLFKDAKLREADFSSTKEEMARRLASLDAREAKIKEWQGNLGAMTKKMDEERRTFLAQTKALEAKASQLSLRELELATKEREAARAPPPAAGTVDVDKEKYFDMWETRMKEREDEFKRRMYQKEKELEAREMAIREQLKAVSAVPGTEGVEATVEVAAQRGDRLRTGTPRLDDLLYGGLPMNANVLFVGPAFVGKEVLMLNFIAEGLKGSVPAVILTTSKPPVEISKEMAPVLPTFMEYEQLGLVRWIDASGTTPTQKLTREGNTYRVPSATDFEGILAAMNQADEEFREKGSPYFRFAFLTLSSSLTQADEKVALGFVQRFVNRLRQSKCVAAFALERGMHTDQQVESLQQLMDGALHFKQDKSKTLMSVVGIGEVQTRDWVPYKFTNKALMIGSFQLERIR